VTSREISVYSMRPLYGPVSGGTRLTITGQYLSTVTAVYFGQHRGFIDKERSAFGLVKVKVNVDLYSALS